MTHHEVTNDETTSGLEALPFEGETSPPQTETHTHVSSSHRQEWAERRLSAMPAAALITPPRLHNRQKINP